MENLVVLGQITATSKKNDGEFTQEIPTKTAYVRTDEENAKKLEDFGLTKYTSRENKEDYFIIKLPQNVMIFLPNGFVAKRHYLSQVTHKGIETNIFKTPHNKLLQLNIIKGNYKNNDFFRLQAIRLDNEDQIEEVKPENPFGDQAAF